METSRTGLFGIGFTLSFVAFLILIVVGQEQGLAWATGLAIVLAVVTLLFLALLLNAQGRTRAPTVVAATPTLTPAPTPTPTKATSATESFYDYKGDVHDVIDVEGIGPIYAEKLKAAGVHSTARLIYIGADEAAAITGVPKKTAEKWIAMCQLIKVNGIGKQYAEALVRGGVLTIEELKKGDPQVLAGQVTTYLDSLDATVLGQRVTEKRVLGWQKKAAAMRRVRVTIPES